MAKYIRPQGRHAARTGLLVQVTPVLVCRLIAPILGARLLFS